MFPRMVAVGLAFGWLAAVVAKGESTQLNLALPTDNDAIFHGGGATFYQYIERDYKGAKSTPWQGGRYGFVRNPTETSAGVVYTRFHEGIDIRCLHRDPRGEPLDEVRAIASGKVVYTNVVPVWSNYGNYIVIEHDWGGSRYYSVYGHLSSLAVNVGQAVLREQRIAVMGYTGQGLNQARAHLHLELNLMFNRRFETWYDSFNKADPNHHGIFNGINLAGLDIARLYLALEKKPSLTIPQFLAREETFYRVIVPPSDHFDLVKFYPWMVSATERQTNPASWEVSFNAAGVPLRIAAVTKAVRSPELSYVKKSSIDYTYLTRGIVGGRGATAFLTDQGKRQMLLLPD